MLNIYSFYFHNLLYILTITVNNKRFYDKNDEIKKPSSFLITLTISS